MKKLLSISVVLAVLLMSALALTACNGNSVESIEVNIYIDGMLDRTVYADGITGRLIENPSVPEDITVNKEVSKCFYGWFLDMYCKVLYTEETIFDGRQSLYGRLLDVSANKYDYELNDGVATITGCVSNDDPALIVPNYIDGYPVKAVKQNIFTRKTLASVAIVLGGIEELDGFQYCDALTKLVLPDSVTTVADNAFEGCNRIEDATITTAAIKALPKSKLKRIDVISGTKIEAKAFYGCSELTDITIADSVTDVGYEAFYNSGVVNATVPTSCLGKLPHDKIKRVIVTSGSAILFWTFDQCKTLEYISLPGSVKTIEEQAFRGCTNLKEAVMNYGLETIGDSAFYGCENLTEINIPDRESINDLHPRDFI